MATDQAVTAALTGEPAGWGVGAVTYTCLLVRPVDHDDRLLSGNDTFHPTFSLICGAHTNPMAALSSAGETVV